MRIALVALYCPSGGMLHYTSQLANALALQAEVHLFSPPNPELEAYLDPRVTFQSLHPVTFLGAPLRSYAAQLNPWCHAQNASVIRAVRPDVVNFVTAHPANALLAPMLTPIPIAFTHHDPSGHPGESSRFRDWLIGRILPQARSIIVHGEALRDELLAQKVPAERIAVIPHGDYGFLKRYSRELPEEDLILFFGRFSKYKGIEVLCQAERLLATRLDGYKLVIAGEGEADLFRAEIGPSGRVEVVNRFHSDAEVAQWFQRARLVVLPYTQASQSGVLAIALAFEKPAIVTAVGGLPEAVQHGEAGLIVPPNDPVALADAIEALWKDPDLRQQLSNAGKMLVAHQISWPIIASRYLDAYHRAVGSRRDPVALETPSAR